jgi:cell division protein FtsQ
LNELLDKATALKAQVSGASWVGNRRWDLRFKSGETLALPEGEKAAAEALLNFARMDGIHRLLGRDLIHFDLRDPDRAYFRKAPKPEPAKVESAISAKNTGEEA